MLFHEPRNWKWMVPAQAAIIMLVLASQTTGVMQVLATGSMFILALAAITNLWIYLSAYAARAFVDKQAVLNATPEVRMAEALQRMHPEAVAAFVAHRRTIWRLKYIPSKDLVDWILDEDPRVHAGFLQFVLDNSNHDRGELITKRKLSEGSRQFDPMGIVTDYEQYDALLALLERKMMLTKAMGNLPPKLMSPYTLDLIRHQFGLDGDDGVQEDAKTATMKRVVQEMQPKTAIPAMPSPQPPTPRRAKQNDEEDAPPLTREELEAISRENARYAAEVG